MTPYLSFTGFYSQIYPYGPAFPAIPTWATVLNTIFTLQFALSYTLLAVPSFIEFTSLRPPLVSSVQFAQPPPCWRLGSGNGRLVLRLVLALCWGRLHTQESSLYTEEGCTHRCPRSKLRKAAHTSILALYWGRLHTQGSSLYTEEGYTHRGPRSILKKAAHTSVFALA